MVGGLFYGSNFSIWKKCNHKQTRNLPTNVILGVAATFFVIVGTGTAVTGLIPGFTPVVIVVVDTPALAVEEVAVDNTTGLVDGMGFPSLVWSFKTCNKTNIIYW